MRVGNANHWFQQMLTTRTVVHKQNNLGNNHVDSVYLKACIVAIQKTGEFLATGTVAMQIKQPTWLEILKWPKRNIGQLMHQV